MAKTKPRPTRKVKEVEVPRAARPNKATKTVAITIPAPVIETIEVLLVGLTPLMAARRYYIEDAGGNGSTGKQPKGKGKAGKEPGRTRLGGQRAKLDSAGEMFEQFQYRFGPTDKRSPRGKHHGFPARGVKRAMERAVKVMKQLKILKLDAKNASCVFDVFPASDGHGDLMAVRFKRLEKDVRTAVNPHSRGPYSVCRPLYMDWEARCKVVYQADFIARADVFSLLMRAGQCGLGALRQECGGSFGLFTPREIHGKR